MEWHIKHSLDPTLSWQMDRLIGLLHRLVNLETTEMATLADIQAEVTAQKSVVASVMSLIQGLAAQIEAAKNDPAAMDAIVADLKANDAALAGAVQANTPAPAPAPEIPPSA